MQFSTLPRFVQFIELPAVGSTPGILINPAHITTIVPGFDFQNAPILNVNFVGEEAPLCVGGVWRSVLLAALKPQITVAAAPVHPGLARAAALGIRPRFCVAHPDERPAYLEAQKAMFGACREAGLNSNDRAAMLRAINDFLGTSLDSRTQMTPDEMERFTAAVERGDWAGDWKRQARWFVARRVHCSHCRERNALYFLVDEAGLELPEEAGGFCRECAPVQIEVEA